MSIISNTEKQDFYRLLNNEGFPTNDFDLQEYEEVTAPANSEIHSHVVVRRKSTGHVYRYLAGHEHHWLMEFERDLRAHEFGRPL